MKPNRDAIEYFEEAKRMLARRESVRPITEFKPTAANLNDLDQQGIDNLLLESIDEGLANILQDTLREPLYRFFEEKYSISRDSIPNRLDDFSSVLEKTFGGFGRKMTERWIARRLYSKLGLMFTENAHYQLQDYVNELKLNPINLLSHVQSSSVVTQKTKI